MYVVGDNKYLAQRGHYNIMLPHRLFQAQVIIEIHTVLFRIFHIFSSSLPYMADILPHLTYECLLAGFFFHQILLVPKGVGGALSTLLCPWPWSVRPSPIVKAATIFRSSTASHTRESPKTPDPAPLIRKATASQLPSS